jgi:hypothetical protein
VFKKEERRADVGVFYIFGVVICQCLGECRWKLMIGGDEHVGGQGAEDHVIILASSLFTVVLLCFPALL